MESNVRIDLEEFLGVPMWRKCSQLWPELMSILGSIFEVFWIILGSFRGHAEAFGFHLGAPWLCRGHFGIHITCGTHFLTKSGKKGSPFQEPFWDYVAYVGVLLVHCRGVAFSGQFWEGFWRHQHGQSIANNGQN